MHMHRILCMYINVRFNINLGVCIYTCVCSNNEGSMANLVASVE